MLSVSRCSIQHIFNKSHGFSSFQLDFYNFFVIARCPKQLAIRRSAAGNQASSPASLSTTGCTTLLLQNIDKPKPALPVSHLLRSRALLSSTKGTWNPVAPASGLSAPASTTEQKTFSDTFHFPTYQGLALDWCMDIGQTCGPQVAETFCKARGYDKASFDGPYKLAFGKTLTLRTEKSCEEPGKCYGFKSITCTGAATRFYYPRHNSGELYDICVTFGHRCNAEAIDAICIDKGFVHSFGFSGPFTVSYTLTVQDHEICDEPHGCGAFIFLDCINTIPYGAGTPRDRVQASMSG